MPDILSSLPSLGLSREIASALSFVFLFAGVAIAAGFVFGRNKLVNIFINIYISLAFTKAAPMDAVSSSPYAEAVFFFVLLVLLTAIDEHLFDLHIPNASYDIFWRLFVMSLLVVGMVTSVLVTLLPKKTLSAAPFTFLMDIFGPPFAHLLWLFVPLVLLLFMNKRLR